MPWAVGAWETNVHILREKAEPCTRSTLSQEDAHLLIKNNPHLIPSVTSRKCLVLEDVMIEDNVVDLLIAEPSKRGVVLHLVFLKWFDYGDVVELTESFDEAYSLIGRDLEYIDLIVASALFLGSERASWARRLKDKLRSWLGRKRVRVEKVYAVVVVNALTKAFVQIINAVNDLTDAYVDALEISEYVTRSGEKIVVTHMFTWR